MERWKDAKRRRSPHWVRQLDDRQLHGIGYGLMRRYRMEGLSSRQDWLLDAVVSELEYRHRRARRDSRRWGRPCVCELCFPEDDVSGGGDAAE